MKTALVVWGGWEKHEPEQCAALVREMLTEDGFDVRVEAGTEALADPDLGKLSLIVPIFTKATLGKPETEMLTRAIEAGTGLGGFHGTADAFRDNVAYQFMVGGQWVAHPGKFIDYRVDVTRSDDPIMAGIESFPYHSEQYYLHVDPANEVLATTTYTGEHAAWIDGVVMPVVWKKRFGAGKVFYSSLGHNAGEFASPQMSTILRRGLNWASRD